MLNHDSLKKIQIWKFGDVFFTMVVNYVPFLGYECVFVVYSIESKLRLYFTSSETFFRETKHLNIGKIL
jgi:hypothetical protein